MGIRFSLVAVVALVLAAFLGVGTAGLNHFFGVTVPSIALVVFLGGVVFRVLKWGRSPVPFRIPTTAGQQKTLSWIPQNKLDNPSTKMQTVGRMVLEVLLFRSLFRNTKFEIEKGPKLYYQWEKWLWLASLAFHYCFLVILIRHLRFFTDPVPFFVHDIERLDGFFQVGLPGLYLTDAIFMLAVTYLLIRRLIIPQLRYITSAGLFSTFPALYNRNNGHSYPLFHQGRPDQGKAVGNRNHLLPSGCPGRHRGHFFHPSFPGEHAFDLFSFQQADARGRHFSEPDAQSSQRQPVQASRKSMELSGKGSYLRGV